MKVKIVNKIQKVLLSESFVAKKVKRKLTILCECDTLADAPFSKLHPLRGKEYGKFALPIGKKGRLIILPITHSDPNSRILDKRNIIGIQVEITFDHYQNIHSF